MTEQTSNQQNENKPMKSRKRRKLSGFLCQELLYDYLLDHLDPDRRLAVEECLAEDGASRQVLDELRRAQAYTEQLANARIQPAVLNTLRDAENVVSLGRRYSSWRAWPETLRWSVSALAISAFASVVISLMPWKIIETLPFLSGPKSSATMVKLAELGRTLPDTDQVAAESAPEGSDSMPVAHDMSDDEEEIVLDESSRAVVSQAAPVAPSQAKVPGPTSVPSTGQAIADAAAPSPADEAEPATGASDEAGSASAKNPRGKGFVYRAFMSLKNLEELAPKITDHIIEMGGEKAGEVELGWRRESGYYYHFALPEVNEEKLLEKLRAYGPVRMSRDPHSRVMPTGQVRFILWVEPL